MNADEVIQELRPKLAAVPGIQVFLQNPPPIRIGGRLTKSQYQFTLQSPDTEELYRYAPVLEARLRQLPELQDVTSDLQIKNPQVKVEIDRDKASALGVTAQQIEDALYTRLRFPADLDHLCPQQPVPGDPGAGAAVPAWIPPPSRCSTSGRPRGNWFPWMPWPSLSQGVGPLTVNHLGPAAGGHHLLQPEAGRVPG